MNTDIGRTLRAAAGALIAVSLFGCASIDHLAVTPATICPSENVNVSWSASGTTTLAQVPLQSGQSDNCVDSLAAGATQDSVPSSGTVRRQITDNSVFYLEAKSWFGKPAHRCARVFVNQALPLSGIPSCAGPRTVRVVARRPAESAWGSQARVGTVQNISGVTVTVAHAGLSARLETNASSEVFSMADPSGDWIIESPLTSGPNCGPGADVPNSLSIQVNPACPH